MSYGKVQDSFWEDPRVETLTDRAALLALFLVSGPHRNAIGCFKLGIGAITDNPRFAEWGIEGVSEALRELASIAFIARDDRTGWTYLPSVLNEDPVKGWKTATSATKLATRVPAELFFYNNLWSQLSSQIEAERAGREIAGYPLRPPSTMTRMPIEGPSKALRSPEPYPEPEPAPQPAALRASDWDPRFEEVQRNCAAILANPNCTGWPRLNIWLRSGADPDRDIYPTLRLRKDKWRSNSLEFFDGPIADAIEARTRPLLASSRPSDHADDLPSRSPETPEQRQQRLARAAREIIRTRSKVSFADDADVAEIVAGKVMTPDQARDAGYRLPLAPSPSSSDAAA